MKHFKLITLTGPQTNTVVMGRKTWESIPPNFRPLQDRKNIVVSRTMLPVDGLEIHSSLNEAINHSVGLCFVIGGSEIYRECLSQPLINRCTQIYLTRIAAEFPCDAFFPATASNLFADPLIEGFTITNVSKTKNHMDISYDFCVLDNNQLPPQPVYQKYLKHEEYQYLDLITDILQNGTKRNDRTLIGTISKFGTKMSFDLSESFPLLTTKLVF